ncbi:HisA/HisF-related TIM barrel protein [Planctomyces sp. SH-PL14]|uniref:HisA/HisF-related TIM barrel protein n=1 Tax=Planctomyces sp. SH-PL14 TaxID=1632864 RepID=UPI00078C8DDC|nr:HisA/HisF-related TIM barrel protein [Planctomyces sp. SH-PL14]AMV17060.1 1-(5-phosphoribosyl)-5-[(5-phosphoribosylamino)methylideneamino] imidazole-4-carboxamide isomerase [Planctomyces sp. SH-PL14]
MKILPVLDLKHGDVVHAVAGRRSEYRPIESRLTSSASPRAVARAVAKRCGTTDLYVADLDAILEDDPQWDLARGLVEDGFRLWLDAGVSRAERAAEAARTGAHRVVVGLESCRSPARLVEIVRAIGADRVTFSLDTLGGRMLKRRLGAWPRFLFDTARRVRAAGVGSFIVLDLSSVGCRRGVTTGGVCQLLRDHPDFAGAAIITGGGIRRAADLEQLRRIPVDYAMISTALHDGTFSIDDLASG